MCDTNLVGDVPSALIGWLADDFVLDGVVLVDDQMKIRLASPGIQKKFKLDPLDPHGKLSGKDYFETMFGLSRLDPVQLAQINRTPLAKAMATGKVEKDRLMCPIVKAKNGFAYQILTRVAERADHTRMVLEFWRWLSHPWEVFKNDPGALSLEE